MAAFLAAVLLTSICFCQAVLGVENAGIDVSRKISLTIDLEAESRRATISLYQVGQWDGSAGKYVLTDEYAPSGADIDGTTASGALEAARKLESYAKEQGMAAIGTQATASGRLTFTGLDNGLYLVCQSRGSSDNVVISPFLTTLPAVDAEAGNWVYDVVSVTKCEPITTPGGSHSGGGHSGGGGGGGGGGNSGGHGAVNTADGGPGAVKEAPDSVPEEPSVPPIIGLLPRTGDSAVRFQIFLGIAIAGAALFAVAARKARKKNGQ